MFDVLTSCAYGCVFSWFLDQSSISAFHRERDRFAGWHCLPDVGMLILLRLHQLLCYLSLVGVVDGSSQV